MDRMENRLNGTTPSTDQSTPILGLRCETITFNRRLNKKGEWETIEVKKGQYSDDLNSDYALVSTRIFNEKHVHQVTELEINSPYILQALASVVKYFPSQPSDFSTKIKIESPFMILYHHWDDLSEYRRSADDEARMHLNLLFSYMEYEMGESRRDLKTLTARGFINWEMVWAIFKPGNMVLGRTSGHWRLCRVGKVTFGLDVKDGMVQKALKVELTGTDYNGVKAGRATFEVKYFQGDMPENCEITSLVYFPAEFLEGHQKIIADLTERGERYLKLRGIQVHRYSGNMLHATLDENRGNWVLREKPVNGRIILDAKTFGTANHAFDPKILPDGAINTTKPKCMIPFWKPIEPMLCPPYIAGFHPGYKRWGFFFVDWIENPEWLPNALDTLVVPDTQKKVIRAIVSSHQFPDQMADQQDQKGKGMVFLLHGSPGTGKTLTAEVVAEHTQRALINITSGELGITVDEIDKKLKTYLQHATTWKAIVLIDEADVFIGARSALPGASLEHNGLVAVFLRHLEYFHGIIFLTSNRIGGTDPAIRSRININLEYRSPDTRVRAIMWRNQISRIPAEEIGFDPEKAVASAAKAAMNGREISNAVMTARTLARYEGKKLGLDHLETVMQVWRKSELGKVEGSRPGGSWGCGIQ